MLVPRSVKIVVLLVPRGEQKMFDVGFYIAFTANRSITEIELWEIINTALHTFSADGEDIGLSDYECTDNA